MCFYFCLLPINSAPLKSTPQIIHILNQHDAGSALVHNFVCINCMLRSYSLTQVMKQNTQSTIGN